MYEALGHTVMSKAHLLPSWLDDLGQVIGTSLSPHFHICKVEWDPRGVLWEGIRTLCRAPETMPDPSVSRSQLLLSLSCPHEAVQQSYPRDHWKEAMSE